MTVGARAQIEADLFSRLAAQRGTDHGSPTASPIVAHISPERTSGAIDLPGVGGIEEGETIYSTSIAEVFGQEDEPLDGPRIFSIDELFKDHAGAGLQLG